MNYSFEYIDIILLAMIAGFIFLRLRGILGKRTGFDGKASPQFEEMMKNISPEIKINKKNDFDENAKKEFINPEKPEAYLWIFELVLQADKITSSASKFNSEISEELLGE